MLNAAGNPNEEPIMRVGLQIPIFTYPDGTKSIRPVLKNLAQLADDSGFYSLWVMDHFFQMGGEFGAPESEMLECYTTLGYFAALTEKIKLGGLITGVVYRYPGILAKTVTTLDVLSGGRAYLGIGAAWYEREALALGVPFPPTKERFEVLEEALQIIHQMWSGEAKPYAGKHFQLAETLCSPLPLAKPHLPIMIGGMGEKKTLRMVAQYADVCNIFLAPQDEDVIHKLDVLKAHCDQLGRSYDEIEKTAWTTLSSTMNVDEMTAIFRRAKNLGITHLIFNMLDVHEIKPLEIFIRHVLPDVLAL
jgi:F420-dependent oxidoreductase-like protein